MPGVKTELLVPCEVSPLASTADGGSACPSDPALAYLASLPSRDSRRTQASALRMIARWFGRELPGFPWAKLGSAEVRAFRAHVASSRAPSTANRYLAALREVARSARTLGLGSSDWLEEVLRAAAYVKGSRLPPGRSVPWAEIQAIFESARADPQRRRGARDSAVVALLFGAGLRRFEVSGLERTAYTGRAVRVMGKGNKEREVPLPYGARRAIDAWLAVRGNAPGPLVENLDEPGKPLQPHAIAGAFKRLLKRAGVRTPTRSHDGRRTFATYLLDDACVPLTVVQQLLGHTNANQTAKYRRGHVRAAERAVELVPVPFE